MSELTLTLYLLVAYILSGFMWYGIFTIQTETLLSLLATIFLLAIFQPLLTLFNVQPTPMDKTLSDADPTDF